MDTAASNLTSEARVLTAVPRRYLGQLCKHFQHKLPVTLSDERGRIEFAGGVCELEADEASGTLTIRIIAPDEAELARLEDVVARHLVRFAFREPPDIQWARRA